MNTNNIPNIFSDSAVTLPEEAHFQFDAYAKTLAQVVLNSGTKTPITIGIDGQWGSGKTTLMKLIDREIHSSANDSSLRKCKTLWFNAWKYEKEETLFTALVTQILQAMKKDGFIKRFMAESYDPTEPDFQAAQMLVNLLYQTVTLGQIDVDFTKYEKETRFKKEFPFLDEFQNLFEKILTKYVSVKIAGDGTVDDSKGALVIFIDDLDRCIPNKIVQMLEIIKLLLDRPGCFFVIGADIKILEAAVQAHYEEANITDIKSSEYLDKIFQVRFALPPIRVDQMNNFIASLPGLDPTLRENLEIISSAIKNPRRIKTFINHIEVQWSIFQNTGLTDVMNKDLLIDWLVINEVSPILKQTINTISDSTVRVLDLVKKLKYLSNVTGQDREDFVKENPDLERFAPNEALLRVLSKSRLDQLDEKNVGFYVHLSDVAPSLLEDKDQNGKPKRSPHEDVTDQVLIAYERKQNPSALGISTRGINLSNKKLIEARFSKTDFSGSDFSNSQLVLADLSSTNLTRANLENANLQEADLRNSNLENATLRFTEFWRANLSGAKLNGSDCEGAIFSEADLTNTDFTGCKLRNAHMDGIKIDFVISNILLCKDWKLAIWADDQRETLNSLLETVST